MKKLSIIMTSRNDNYGGNLINRMLYTLNINLELLKKLNINYEYILVDYNTIKNPYFYQLDEFKTIFKNDRFKSVVVPHSLIKNKDYKFKESFFEYFAKNVGVRYSNGEYILILNIDIILSEDILNKIKIILEDDNINLENFYRPLYRYSIQMESGLNDIKSKINLNANNYPDKVVCGLFSGDFLFLNKEVFINKGMGYNEKDSYYKNLKVQTSMDGEILWNLHYNGIKLKFLDSYYYHVDHEKISFNGRYLMEKYDNIKDWGLLYHENEKISNNIILIK